MSIVNYRNFTDIVLEDDDCLEITTNAGAVWVNLNGVCLLRAKVGPLQDADIVIQGVRQDNGVE